MKVLLISNQHLNKSGVGNPIMYRMCNALGKDNRVDHVAFLPFYNKLSSFSTIRKSAKEYDVVHVHFGGLYALLTWISLIGIKKKKFITFHGTDIHAKQSKTAKRWKDRLKIRLNQKASFLSIRLFHKCGFVAAEMMNYVPKYLNNHLLRKAFLQPLGVDYSMFVPMDKCKAQKYLGLDVGNYVLFSDVSNTKTKRRDIAEAIIEELGTPYQLLIMCGVKPTEVPYYINACDFAILTSDEEGSPNIIREVLSLNKPFFSVEVGDAAKQLSGLNNSSIISRKPHIAAGKIAKIMNSEYTDNTRLNKKVTLDFMEINKSIVQFYADSL